jgi:predicted phosphodiesterase
MRYLVLTDIHANLEALNACLADAAHRGFERSLVLGDLIGYGADPNLVVDRVRALGPQAIVRGNHDRIAFGIDRAKGFNAVATTAAQWTFDTLTDERRAWLTNLPRGPIDVDALVQICHGAPFDEDAYIFDESEALRALHASTRPLCLFGHTHCPVAFSLSGRVLDQIPTGNDAENRLRCEDGTKYLLNPGSVGQPRDGDSRTAYAIVDTDERTVDVLRLAYDLATTQRKIVNAGLPEVLARRLTAGR